MPPSALQAGLRKAAAGVRVANALAAGTPPKPKADPNKIKVGVRCRPLNRTELSLNDDFVVQFDENAPQLCITNPQPLHSEDVESMFAYDHVYGEDSTSEQVFEDMGKPLVDSLFDGFNASIFAYGQTGSGKTHTMMGTPGDQGLIPRVCRNIFERIEALGDGSKVTVVASYLQIYREVLQDLLGDSKDELKIRRDPKMGTYVQGLSEHELSSASGLTALIDAGNKKRAVASTQMNSESSRSHAVVIIRVQQQETSGGACGVKALSESSAELSETSAGGAARCVRRPAPRPLACTHAHAHARRGGRL